MDPIKLRVGWIVMRGGDPVRTASTSPFHKSAKLYTKIGNAKSVAKQYDGVVHEAFVEVPATWPPTEPFALPG